MNISWRPRASTKVEQPDDLRVLFPSEIRPHREFHKLAPGFHVEAFWKSVNGHEGPGASVYILGHELLRFDCMGHPIGHFHATIGGARRKRSENRVRLPESSPLEQARRAAFEVRWNLRYFQHRHGSRQVRNLEIDDDALAAAEHLLNERLAYFCQVMPGRAVADVAASGHPGRVRSAPTQADASG